MTTLPVDGLDLLADDCRDAMAWRARTERDRLRAEAVLTPTLRRATQVVLARAVAAGAEAVALTGSTVRARRTAISDLDVHVVGPRPALTDVDVDLDVYATTADVLSRRLAAGDDYVQWTLRFGCILFDRGVLRAAAADIVAAGSWPSAERKREQARRMLDLAGLVIESRDRDAAVEQTRSALTAVARSLLLAAGAFPLSRDELPGQLRGVGHAEVAGILRRCIDEEPSIETLAAGVELGRRSIATPGAGARRRGVVRQG